MKLLVGKKTADEFALKLKDQADRLKMRGVSPKLVIVLIDPTESSQIYVRMKLRRAEQIGITIEQITLREKTQSDYEDRIRQISECMDVHGIIIQLPIPGDLNKQALLDCIPQNKDVDGLTTANLGEFESGKPIFWPATPRGILKLMRNYHITVADKTVTVIGRSNLVGRPLACLLRRKGAHTHVAHIGTPDIAALTLTSDIVISAAGAPGLVTASMIKKNAVIIDVGITKQNGHIVGDVDFASVKDKVSYISPVPGGVGPMTVVMLMSNVLKSARRHLTD